MNAERLHAIAIAVRDDLQQTDVVTHLQQMRDSLQNQVNQPQDPSHQQRLSELFQQLAQSLESAQSNQFSPAWQQLLEEVGGRVLLGAPLLATIREIFERNQITPSVALDELQGLHQQVEQLDNSVNGLISSMSQLHIGAEELEPGGCEVGVLIPRSSVENKLDEFGRELSRLHKILGVFAELVTGARPGFEIRTISSTDLSVFLDSSPVIAASIAVTVERIVALYKKMLEIRVLRNQLSDQGVPDPPLHSIDEHVNHLMGEGIEGLVGELDAKYAAIHDAGRRNELRTELGLALNQIANRIDKGYNFEIRAQPIEETEGESEDRDDASKRESIDAILKAAEGLQFLKLTGDHILSLPEPGEDDTDNSG